MTPPPTSRPAPADAGQARSRRVWDGFVRAFHWSLVGCVLANALLTEEGERVHQLVGHAASALVLARVLWGFVGPGHARFADFWPTRARLRAYIGGWLAGQAPHHWGHNPVGALMMLWLMALVLLLGLTGWMQGLEAFWGDAWLQEVHEAASRCLLLSASVHAVAAWAMGRLERTDLVQAMLTGVKTRH